MKKIWTTIILLSMTLPAMGQPIIGPLQAQNNLDEITQNGTTATAQVNLFGYTITLGGNFATSGANSLTFTTTGPTNVTLPTSGTLATTSGGSFNNPTFTGTVTGPDSSTWTSSGIGGLTALGVNESVPPTGDVNISGIFEVAGSQIAASNLSNGTTGSGAVVLAASPTFTLVPLAPTAPSTTNTTQLATTGFTQNVTNFRKATIYIALGSTAGGTLSFATNGVGLTQTFTASGGVITSLGTIFNGGSGYKVGDVVTFPNNTSFQGNNDDYVEVTTVSGTAVTGDMILYGGTGYVSGTNQTVSLPTPFPAVFINTGILTSNLTVILPNGTGIGNSDQVAVYNNTTGSFATTLCQSNGSDACNGGPTVIIPQGTNNSAPMLIENDATTGIYSLVGGNATFSILNSTSGALNGSIGQATTFAGSFTTITGSGSGITGITYAHLPALSANQVLGSVTATTPSGLSLPSCSLSNDALSWTSGTGFGCNTLASSSPGLVGIQVFTASGTYTEDAGTQQIIVEVVGQGGGGGGCASTSSSQNCSAGSGGSGSYAKVYYTSGFSPETITIGTAGAGGSAGDNAGTAGSTVSFGALVSCSGGAAGQGNTAIADTLVGFGTITGSLPADCTISGGTSLDDIPGAPPQYSIINAALNSNFSGAGANSPLGTGGVQERATNNGAPGRGFGAGGSGGSSANSGAAVTGGNPSGGEIIVYEFN